MTEIRLEDLNLENVGVIADLSNLVLSDEEDDDNDSYKKELDEELNKIKDFIKRHPLPPVDENEEFWKDVISRFRDNSGLNLMAIYSFVRFDILKEMYENLTDEDIIKDCGKKLNRDGKFNAMIINHYILSGAIRKLNKEDSLVDGQMRIIEFWWDGIGEWKA